MALQLSPSNVDMAVGIVEKLALPAPPASLGYGSSGAGGGGTKSPSHARADWPSTPIPELEDISFGLTEAVLGPLRESMNFYFGARGPEVLRAGSSVWRGGAGGMGSHSAVGKPSLCLVAGDALGARLLGWCTVFCRSPQWRGLFSDRSASSSASPAPLAQQESSATDAFAGKKRTAEDMEDQNGGEEEEAGGEKATPTPAGTASGIHHNDGGRGQDKDAPAGLAQLLGVVGRVVRIVKEHTKVAGDRPGGGVGSFPGTVVGGARVAAGFDQRTKESSRLAQVLVGSLADAVLDTFAGHMADPVFHGRLRQEAHADGEMTGGTAGRQEGGVATAMSDVVPLVDGASPAEAVGLSVELAGDLAWLFSSLEPEPEAGAASSSGRDRGSAAKVSPAAVQLSSALSCWVSGRVLACMPGREHLEYALALSPSGGGVGSDGMQVEEGASVQAAGPPSVRPLPARLACFAVRTLLDQLQVCKWLLLKKLLYGMMQAGHVLTLPRSSFRGAAWVFSSRGPLHKLEF